MSKNTPKPNTTNSELIEELRQGSEARHMANRVTPDGKELVEMIPLDWAVEVIEALIASKVEEARIEPFDFVESCEPDCTPERHAYHQGQWEMAQRIKRHYGHEEYPGGEALQPIEQDKV